MQLHFSGTVTPELTEVRFGCPGGDEQFISVRGFKLQNGANGTFQWSRAVQAVSVLLLKTKAYCVAQDRSGLPFPVIAGERNSLASSLDYALAKQPLWLLDMFGVQEDGKSTADLLFPRRNRERKRPGPVIISVEQALLRPENIAVFYNRLLVSDASALNSIEQSIAAAFAPAGEIRPPKARSYPASTSASPTAPVAAPGAASYGTLMSLIENEVLQMLREAYVFAPRKVKASNERYYSDAMIRKVYGGPSSLTSAVDRSLTSSERLGVVADENLIRGSFDGFGTLRFAVTALDPSSLALLTFLKHVKRYNIDYEYFYEATGEIADGVLNGGRRELLHGFIASPYQAARLLAAGRRCEYEPLMPLPKVTHRVVAPAHAGRRHTSLERGCFAFLWDEPTTNTSYFDDLVLAGYISRPAVRIVSIPGHEMVESIRQAGEDLKAVITFPYYNLCCLSGSGQLVDGKASAYGPKESTLFVLKSFFEHQGQMARMIDIAVRDAWLELAEGGASFRRVMEIIAADKIYMKYLSRVCGMHTMHLPGVAESSCACSKDIATAG